MKKGGGYGTLELATGLNLSSLLKGKKIFPYRQGTKQQSFPSPMEVRNLP